MRNTGLEEAQAGIKIAGRNINNLRYADDTTLITQSKEEVKSLFKVKEESEKVGLKLNIQKTKIMASSPITSWQTDGETMETVTDFIFWAPESLQMVITAMKLKDTLWKGSYDQPRQHIKTQRHYFVNKGLSCQGYGFSSSHLWMWELYYKKAEHQRIDAFELWCWRRLLKVPWTARSNQSILKEISPGYSLERSWNSNTLATWCEELTHLKRPWC